MVPGRLDVVDVVGQSQATHAVHQVALTKRGALAGPPCRLAASRHASTTSQAGVLAYKARTFDVDGGLHVDEGQGNELGEASCAGLELPQGQQMAGPRARHVAVPKLHSRVPVHFPPEPARARQQLRRHTHHDGGRRLEANAVGSFNHLHRSASSVGAVP